MPETPTREGPGTVRRIWERLRHSSVDHRRSRRSLARFCREVATDEYTLVVHSVDVDYKTYFPNSFVLGTRRDRPANVYTDGNFQDLQLIGTESFGCILCTALFEHVPEPERIVSEFHRILKPGGRLILSASAVFPFHGGADNFFHFTPNGFRHLFRNWSRFEVLRGSSRPFATIGILLQRINIQCDVLLPLRPLITLLYHVVPLLDVFVVRQYDSAGTHTEQRMTDSFMPAALHAVIIK